MYITKGRGTNVRYVAISSTLETSVAPKIVCCIICFYRVRFNEVVLYEEDCHASSMLGVLTCPTYYVVADHTSPSACNQLSVPTGIRSVFAVFPDSTDVLIFPVCICSRLSMTIQVIVLSLQGDGLMAVSPCPHFASPVIVIAPEHF